MNANGTHLHAHSHSHSHPSTNNSYKLKQQRNYGNNRYDPLSTQSANYQSRNSAQQYQGQWNNGLSAGIAGANPSAYGAVPNAYALPHHYHPHHHHQQQQQQQASDLYAGYYGQGGQASFEGAAGQASAYGQYAQEGIPVESSKGGHVVYVYGIGQRATQEEIFALFQPFGHVLRVDIIIDFNTGLCKG